MYVVRVVYFLFLSETYSSSESIDTEYTAMYVDCSNNDLTRQAFL